MTQRAGRLGVHLIRRGIVGWDAGYVRDRVASHVWLDLYRWRFCVTWRAEGAR